MKTYVLYSSHFFVFHLLTSNVRSDKEVTVAANEDGEGGVRCRVKHVIRDVMSVIDIDISVNNRRILFKKIRRQ